MRKFIPQYQPVIKLRYIYAVVKQMLSGWVGTGKKVEEFEETIIDTVVPFHHAIATTSGTMALYIAICALEIPKDKKIIFPAYTFLAGANVAKHLGYDVEFLDVDKDTMCIDPDVLAARLEQSNDVGLVIYVDHNGIADRARDIEIVCMLKDVRMIEDSAQGLGMKDAGIHGDIGIFSFSVPKLITTGQGGVAFTKNVALASKMRQLRDHGDNWRSTKIHEFVGLNLKFNDILAAYGVAQLQILDALLKKRDKIFAKYGEYLSIKTSARPSTWMVIYETDKADKIIGALKYQDIQAVKYYRPVPSNPSFGVTDSFPNAEYIYEHCVYLPSSLNLTGAQIRRICHIIKKVENND